MLQVVLTLALIGLGLGIYIYGAYRLAKYGFRLSSGIGWMVLLFPPYTFYFAFKKLEVEGKEFPTAMASFGLLMAIGLAVMFSYDLQMVFTGQIDELVEEMDVQLVENTSIDESELPDTAADEAAEQQEETEPVEEETEQEEENDGTDEESDAEDAEEEGEEGAEDEEADAEDEAGDDEESEE